MSQNPCFLTDVQHTVLGHLLGPDPDVDITRKLQRFWLNVLPTYFRLSDGYHIDASTYTDLSPSEILFVDIYSHRNYNSPEEIDRPTTEPTSNLHLRIICAAKEISNATCLETFNVLCALKEGEEATPYNQPRVMISRLGLEGQILAKRAYWAHGNLLLAEKARSTDVSDARGQALLNFEFQEWAGKGDYMPKCEPPRMTEEEALLSVDVQTKEDFRVGEGVVVIKLPGKTAFEGSQDWFGEVGDGEKF